MKPPSRKYIILAIIIGLPLIIGSICLWSVLIDPLVVRHKSIKIAEKFLEAYSDGDCASAMALMKPDIPIPSNYYSDPAHPENFCIDYKFQIVKLDRVRSTYFDYFWSPNNNGVFFDGIFEIEKSGAGTYPCPLFQVDVSNVGKKLEVYQWRDSFGGIHSCKYLFGMRSGPYWPHGCTGANDFPLGLRKIDNKTIEITFVRPQEGIFYIFYKPSLPNDTVTTHKFSGNIAIYPKEGQWLAVVDGETKEIDPWSNGHFVYKLENLRTLPGKPTWEICLIHNWETAYGEIK